MRLLPPIACCLLLGCVGPSCPDGVRCPDGVPASCDAEWVQCRTGLFFAECGSGDSEFIACTQNRCLRFRGECASGYRPTACPFDDVCCQQLDGEPWAWTEAEPEGCPGCEQQRDALSTIASLRRATIEEDPGLAGTAPGEPVCTGSAVGLQSCSSGQGVERQQTHLSQTVRFSGPTLAARNVVVLEIMTEGDETTAWVGLETYTDLVGFSPPAACLPPAASIESATLTLAALPATSDTRGRLALSLSDESTLTLEF